MALTREEISQIAKASAQTVLEGLNRYAVDYKEPETIGQGLQDSMVEERTAADWYDRRADHARHLGDEQAAKLYEHIAGEESKHWGEFNTRFYALSVKGSTLESLAITEDNPIRKFCCRQCGECVYSELLEEGKFPERIDWLRHHYEEKHPGMWSKVI